MVILDNNQIVDKTLPTNEVRAVLLKIFYFRRKIKFFSVDCYVGLEVPLLMCDKTQWQCKCGRYYGSEIKEIKNFDFSC